MFRRPHYIALILVVLFVAALSRLPSQTLSSLKLAIGGMFSPLFGAAAVSHRAATETGDALIPRKELLRQNEELRRANQEMYFQLRQDEEVWRENNRLRKMVHWQSQTRWNLKLARVVARDPASWWHSIQINLGRQNGIQPNLAVLTPEGLIGRVQTVGETRSQVELLGDPDLRVAVNVKLGTGLTNQESGILLNASSTPQENNMVDLDFLPGNSRVRPGQAVVTSEQWGIFKTGIPVGTVVDTRTKDFGLSTEARVKLSADLSSLEEVWVMLP